MVGEAGFNGDRVHVILLGQPEVKLFCVKKREQSISVQPRQSQLIGCIIKIFCVARINDALQLCFQATSARVSLRKVSGLQSNAKEFMQAHPLSVLI